MFFSYVALREGGAVNQFELKYTVSVKIKCTTPFDVILALFNFFALQLNLMFTVF